MMEEVYARRFTLVRDKDVTGVSGTGVIAEGVLWSDESVALKWYPVEAHHAPSVAIWPSLDDMMRVHGHDGATRVEWVDG